MKTLATLLVLLLSQTLIAQEVAISTYIERTMIGNKMGFAVGYKFPYGITVGGFYQEAPSFFSEPESKPYAYERVFTGSYIVVPVNDHIDFNVRTGVSNGRNFMISPSLWGYLKVMKALDLGVGIGARSFHPTLQTSIRFRISNN